MCWKERDGGKKGNVIKKSKRKIMMTVMLTEGLLIDFVINTLCVLYNALLISLKLSSHASGDINSLF